MVRFRSSEGTASQVARKVFFFRRSGLQPRRKRRAINGALAPEAPFSGFFPALFSRVISRATTRLWPPRLVRLQAPGHKSRGEMATSKKSDKKRTPARSSAMATLGIIGGRVVFHGRPDGNARD
jgi:hypothetical protein